MKSFISFKKAYLLFCLACLSILNVAHSAVPTIEREALETLYNSTDGANWKSNTNVEVGVIIQKFLYQGSPKTGLWYNPNRSGHGLNIELAGSSLVAVWYTYLPDGSPTWYLASNAYDNSGSWSATLQKFTWNASNRTTNGIDVGTIWLDFSDENKVNFTWTLDGQSGSEPFQLLVTGSPSPILDYTGLWYPPSDSGWGLTDVTSGNAEVAVLYFYDTQGDAVWGLGVKDGTAGSTVPLDIYSGFCPNCATVTPIGNPLGNITTSFDSQTSGTIQTSIDKTVQISGWSRDINWNINTIPIAMLSTPSTNGPFSIKFISDKSVIMQDPGNQADFSVKVYDAIGNELPSVNVEWSLSSNSGLSLSQITGKSVRVTANSIGTDTVHLEAKMPGTDFKSTANIHFAELTPNSTYIDSTLLISSPSIKSAATSNKAAQLSFSLDKTTLTQGLKVGDVIISGDEAGLLFKIISITVNSNSVDIVANHAKITDAIANGSVSSIGNTSKVQILFDGKKNTYKTKMLGLKWSAEKSIGDFECTNESNNNVGVEIVGSGFETQLDVHGEIDVNIENSTLTLFESKIIGEFNADANSGTIEFNSTIGGNIKCEVEIGTLSLPAIPVYAFSFVLKTVSFVGIDLNAGISGPSFYIEGPSATLDSSLELGMKYRNSTGWSKVGSVGYQIDYSPLSSEFNDSVSIDMYMSPYVRFDLGFDVNLGRPPFAYTLADFRFIDLKGSIYLDFGMQSPFDPTNPNYSGPNWSSGGEISGKYKAELAGGALLDLLDVLDIPVEVNLTGNLFTPIQKTGPSSPYVDQSLNCGNNCIIDPNANESVTINVDTDANDSSTVTFMKQKNNANTLTSLASRNVNSGTASYNWTPSSSDVGDYKLYPRLYTSGLGAIFPYASNSYNSLSVESTQTTTYNLTVSTSGTGTVTSNPTGINCGSDCTQSYNSGQSVTLTATPVSGWSFDSWSGACSGSGSCVISMTSNKSVTAHFIQQLIPTATAQWFTTNNVLEDSIGNNTLKQNSEVNTVNAELINGMYVARFDGSGNNNGSNNDGTPPNGDHPYLYRTGTLLGSNDGTVAFWMKVTVENSSGSGLFYERSTSWGHLQITRSPGDLMSVRYGIDDINRAQATVTGVGSWIHIAAVHSNNTLRFYVNGNLVATGSAGSPGSALATVIGSTRNGSTYFVGDMHDYNVWVGTVLTDQQIKDIYNEKAAVLSGANAK